MRFPVRPIRRLLRVLPALAAVVALAAACEAPAPQVKVPARMLYLQAQALSDDGLVADAITEFQQVADQNPGTRLGSFANLRLAELQMRNEAWPDAVSNYRLFLTLNSNTHLTSYVLFRLMKANHENSYTGLIFRSREIDRDMEPNRQLIREYKRFYFLYPQSRYLDEATAFYRDARESLAAHEHMVGDYYYEREQYNAAASRYLYLLRNYPDYDDSRTVLRQLIRAYRRNQQPELAREMEQIYGRLFGRAGAEPPGDEAGVAGGTADTGAPRERVAGAP